MFFAFVVTVLVFVGEHASSQPMNPSSFPSTAPSVVILGNGSAGFDSAGMSALVYGLVALFFVMGGALAGHRHIRSRSINKNSKNPNTEENLEIQECAGLDLECSTIQDIATFTETKDSDQKRIPSSASGGFTIEESIEVLGANADLDTEKLHGDRDNEPDPLPRTSPPPPSTTNGSVSKQPQPQATPKPTPTPEAGFISVEPVSPKVVGGHGCDDDGSKQLGAIPKSTPAPPSRESNISKQPQPQATPMLTPAPEAGFVLVKTVAELDGGYGCGDDASKQLGAIPRSTPAPPQQINANVLLGSSETLLE